jgi:cytochrome c biogenesis protein CcmG, thiol:disulfide interchange protein DsbE
MNALAIRCRRNLPQDELSRKSANSGPSSRVTITDMSRVKPILFFVVVAAAALFFVLRKPSSTVVNVGDPAPEFSIKDDSGKEFKLSDYRGNVVFLNFWYTTCPPCIKEMPDMELVNRVFKDRKFKMVPVSVDINLDDVKKFYQDNKLTTMPMYLDPGKQVAHRYNVVKFPETYIIDGNGIVQKHYIGERVWSNATYMNLIEEFVKKQEAAPASSASQ